MSSEWIEVRLDCLTSIYSGFAFSSKDMANKGIPIIKIGNIQKKVVLKQCDAYFPKNQLSERHKKYFLEKNDILIAMTGAGSVGKFGKMLKQDKKYLVNQRVGIIRANEKVNATFLYYILTMSNYERYLYNIGVGAGQPNISAKDIGSVSLNIPDLKTQEKIADVLSTYDELIENNNRRIEILEKAAEEIYKEWFVRLRFPGHENSKFINGIPEGWEVRKVADVISFDIGGGWGKDVVEDGFTEKAYVIRGTDIPDMRYGNYNYEILRFHKKSNLKNRKLKNGDIIFEVSGGSTYQRLGRTIFITDEILSMYDEDVICASFCKLIRINNKYLGWFFNNYLKYAYETELLSTFEVQSTGISNFGFVNFKKHHNILIPSENFIRDFYYLTYEMYITINKLQKQNQNLIKQRDLLLPRLMNGTIEVK